MSDKLITVSFPQGDSVAAHHFGEALIRMSAAMEYREYPVIGEERLVGEDGSLKATSTSAGTEQAQTPPAPEPAPVTAHVAEDVPPPPPPVAAPTEYPAGQNIYMVSPSDVDVLIISKFAERDDLLSKGWRIISKEELAEFEPAEAGHPGDLDSEGLPWDERIHSGSKGKVKDGTWRLRKTPTDMSAEQWQQYVAETKASLKMPETGEDGDHHYTDTGVVREETVAGIPPIAPPPIPVPPVVDAPANLPVQGEYTGPKTFPELMAFMMDHHGVVTPHIPVLCTRAKIAHVNDLHKDESGIPAFYQDLVNTCGL